MKRKLIRITLAALLAGAISARADAILDLPADGLAAVDPGVSVGTAAAATNQGRVAATVPAGGGHGTERAPVGAKVSKQLGSVRNEVASTLLPGTRYDNIVNIGCGWASGVNFTGSYDWPSLLQSIRSDPANVYDILTSPQNMTRYQNRYAILVKEALEARDGTSINLIDVAKTGHTSPYGQFEIDDLDAIIAAQFGGKLSGNTLVLYEFGPPDFIRLVSMLFDRDPELNPIATSLGGEPLPPGAAAFGDSYWQARFVASQGGDSSIQAKVLQRYAGHFLPTQTRRGVPYVDETDVLGPPYSNKLTVSDRFFASYARDYKRLLRNPNGKKGVYGGDQCTGT